MIKLDNFSKIAIFKFGSNFQVNIYKKAIKVKKFSAAARLAAAAHASACKKVISSKKKSDERKKFKNSIFWMSFQFLRKNARKEIKIVNHNDS